MANAPIGKGAYAVYAHCGMWLTDTCAGGSWSHDVTEAVWFDSAGEARESLAAAEILETVVVCRVR